MERHGTTINKKKTHHFIGITFQLGESAGQIGALESTWSGNCCVQSDGKSSSAAGCCLRPRQSRDTGQPSWFCISEILDIANCGQTYLHTPTLTVSSCILLIFFLEIEALARSVSVQRVLKTGLASLCIRSMTRRPRRHVKNATKPHSTAFCIASMTNFERMLRPSMDEMAELDEMDARAGRKRPRCAGMRATKRFWCKEKQLQLHDPKANMEGVAAIREPRKIRMERHCLPGGHFARALASVDESHENLQNTYSDIWYTIQYIIIYC